MKTNKILIINKIIKKMIVLIQIIKIKIESYIEVKAILLVIKI